jgi:aminoglycoside phosphotransferase (APT) family kinase protein
MGAMKPNTRLRWEQLPDGVRVGIEHILGARVTGALSQAGGFSPGTADRLTASDGRRAFAKAMSRGMNARSFELFQLEAEVSSALAGIELPAPQLLGIVEQDDWIALVFEDIDGRQPGAGADDIAAVFGALARLPLLPDGIALPDGERRAEIKAARWSADWTVGLGEGVRDVLPPAGAAHLDDLLTLAAQAPAAVAGQHLVHMDIRPDNVVVDRAGVAWLVDWPWAVVGAPWIDALSYLLGLAMTEPPEAVDRWASSAPLASATPEQIDAVMAAVCGNLFRNSVEPPPPSLVGLREFQREFALRTLDWLAYRCGW